MILPQWNMLVVDDDRQLCESTVTALKAIGIDAEWTLDGESAIRKVEESHERHQDYQIILLDWKLPGIDGIETARRIRKHMGDQVPILLRIRRGMPVSAALSASLYSSLLCITDSNLLRDILSKSRKRQRKKLASRI